MKQTGALVISLDFELHWGIRDQFPVNGTYTPNLEGARTVIPKILELFETYDVAATWATVGFLFAKSKQELESHSAHLKPQYRNKALDAYAEPLGQSEADDPLHFAPSLVRLIQKTARQELSTHTFCHYYCLEEGQTSETFKADLESAISIAESIGNRPKSIILPRNQMNPEYASVMRELGINIYRGNEPGFMYQAASTVDDHLVRRAFRLLDTYLPITKHHLARWGELREANGLINIPSSRILRAYSSKLRRLEPLRLKRITDGMTLAAKQNKLYHLWWHPHNFGLNQDENLSFLGDILTAFSSLQKMYGMQSLSMLDVAQTLDD